MCDLHEKLETTKLLVNTFTFGTSMPLQELHAAMPQNDMCWSQYTIKTAWEKMDELFGDCVLSV
jgi:hypothetical protein